MRSKFYTGWVLLIVSLLAFSFLVSSTENQCVTLSQGQAMLWFAGTFCFFAGIILIAVGIYTEGDEKNEADNRDKK